jgi:type II secretory pathway pseudopilin PulG
MMKKKRALTLLEVAIAIVLLGFLLTGLFHTFRQSLKKNISARELKQKVFQLELFQQKMKTLLSRESGIKIGEHPQAPGLSLFFNYSEKTDPDFEMCGEMQAMLFLSDQKELCLATWSAAGKCRTEVLLDHVDTFTPSLFDPKKGEWKSTLKEKAAEKPVMASVELVWNKAKLKFAFFLKTGDEKITYKGEF